MGVGQLSESDAVDALRLPFYSSSHPTGSHGWRNQFDLGNPDLVALAWVFCSSRKNSRLPASPRMGEAQRLRTRNPWATAQIRVRPSTLAWV